MRAGSQTVPRARARPTARGVLLAAVVAVLAVFSAVPVRQYLDQRGEIADLGRQILLLEDANAELERWIARLHDPAELERLARECLGMVKSGEVAFVVVPKGGEPQPPPC
ncbi:MAG: FtsB family cell division protein [Actinomycetota bacterium]